MTVWTPDTDPDCQIEISDDPATRGQVLGFVKPSKVHASAEEVLSENRSKNMICAEVARIAPGVAYNWRVGSDRMIEIQLLGQVNQQVRNRLANDVVAETEFDDGQKVIVKNKMRLL